MYVIYAGAPLKHLGALTQQMMTLTSLKVRSHIPNQHCHEACCVAYQFQELTGHADMLGAAVVSHTPVCMTMTAVQLDA